MKANEFNLALVLFESGQKGKILQEGFCRRTSHLVQELVPELARIGMEW